MLGQVTHITVPIEATPWQDIPALYERLEGRGTVAACLQYMILTLVRSAGCRGARFDEFRDGVWTVPAERMKGRAGKTTDFRVPISQEAERLIEQQSLLGSDVMFPGVSGKPISDVALTKHLNLIGEAGRAHGFRTSFRTWVQDTDACSWEVSETVLAHSIGGKVERSYARSDLLDRRRIVMEKWAKFVTGEKADVVNLRNEPTPRMM
jgi:integrase